MKATARRDADGTYKHTVQVREHQLTVDEPPEMGGDDTAPSPQELLAVSLASCTAITMEMYAARKGWEIGHVEVEVQYKGAERGCPTKFELVMRLPADLPEEQAERLRVIAAKCPVHRALDGEVMFEERVERVAADRLTEPVSSAVLVPLFIADEEPHAVFTRRRADLRRHAGEISFPGGRRDPEDSDLRDTALREAEEEIGLPRAEVSLLGELPPTSTFVTNYVIHPFVGLIPTGLAWQMSEREVDVVLELPLQALRASRTRTRIERRGISFETDAYILDDHLIWGATARILEHLLERVEELLLPHLSLTDLPASQRSAGRLGS